MNFSVRRSDSGDLPSVAELLQASYPVLLKAAYEPAALDPALKLLTRANRNLLSSGTYYVAEAKDGTLVGCGGWTHDPPGGDAPQRGLGHIRHFAVHPGWIRRGIGTAIYQLCEAEARVAGIHTFECYATLNAESFYSSLGFERIAIMDVQLTQGVSLKGCHMCRQV